MIIYFASRDMRVLGHATTTLQKGIVIIEDLKTEETETGVATFSCRVGFNEANRLELEAMTNAGNFLLRSNEGENEFYTIIDAEIDSKDQSILIYAEDAGLDLINEIAGEFEATETQTAEWYINKYINDSGFVIGINEIPATQTRKLKWEGEDTVTARLASIATQFGGYEISYSFDIKGLIITNKYVNIHKKRGKDDGIQLRLNKEIDKIITTKSVANLATAFVCEGGVPDKEEEPITLKGYAYDDGDFYVDANGTLKSRNAVGKWSRYYWKDEPNQLAGNEGHIVRPYSYNTTDQATLCSHAITELKKCCDMEVNYEIDIKTLPEGVKIGDRINIIDDAGELYVSTRVLKLESSIVDDKYTATLGEHLIKTSGISQKVTELAANFAKTSQSAARALVVATTAQTKADAAQGKADAAAESASEANKAAEEAEKAASAASASATTAAAEALAAEAAVGRVEQSVQSIQQSVENAEKAAENAQKAIITVEEEAAKAANAASNAREEATKAQTAAGEAKTASEAAVSKADSAISTAGEATTLAQSASDVAAAAKLDAEQAAKDVEDFGKELETTVSTMKADYARKTDLTETTAALESQIKRSAGLLSSTISMRTVIDDTANNAETLADQAKAKADKAKELADEATEAAEEAQAQADSANTAAEEAQAQADKANAAAENAQAVLNQAEADLVAARVALEEVKNNFWALPSDIEAAERAVAEAEAAAVQARANASVAIQTATTAQAEADAAKAEADEAQAEADAAKLYAENAQALANETNAAYQAQVTADDAVSSASSAQATAAEAVQNATSAQEIANQAASEAAAAQAQANAADAKVAQAQSDLNEAKQNLASTMSRVDATEEEIRAAEEALQAAQEVANTADALAKAAQSTADTAKANAITAQQAADEAQTKADEAQAKANEAKAAADKAQADVNDLGVRVTTAETGITQTKEQIALCAKKTDVYLKGETYSRTETDAKIKVSSDSITSTVSTTYEKMQSKGEQLIVNGNAMMGNNTNFSGLVFDGAATNNSPGSFTVPENKIGINHSAVTDEYFPIIPQNWYKFSLDVKSKLGLGTMYTYLGYYDVDKLAIQGKNCAYLVGSTTKLAQDLKPGDTVAYVADLSNWKVQQYYTYISVWNYTNSFGYTYPTETYTRNLVGILQQSGSKPAEDAFDYSNNCIKLASAYTGATIPAGTDVSQCFYATSYYYIPLRAQVIPQEWTTYSAVIKGINNEGTTAPEMFPHGTAYAKIGFLFNNNKTAGEQQWITNVTVTDFTDAGRAQDTADNAMTIGEDMQKKTGDLEKEISAAESIIQQLSDAINMLVTDENGTTLLQQTSTGWSFNLKSVQDNVESATEQLGTLTEDLGSTNAAVNTLNAAVKDLGVLAEYIKIGTYTYKDNDGTERTEPSIDLGEQDTGFKLKITNTRIWFTDGSTDLVSIDSKNKSLDIGTARIKGELHIGNAETQTGTWLWKQRENGNLGLMWKGVNS